MAGNMWDELINPFPNHNGAAFEVWEWINNFISHFIHLWLLIHSGIHFGINILTSHVELYKHMKGESKWKWFDIWTSQYSYYICVQLKRLYIYVLK